jgi:hypothetical protein
VRSRQLALDLNGDIPDGPIPVVYLACRLTGLTSDQRKLLDSWCTHVEQVVTETAAESEDKWNVAVHIPFTWSAPWSDRRPPEKIYEVNSTTVSGSAAVIILSIDGGGLGVGQEFAWATALRLPILVVHPVDQPPSRQTIGTPADVTVAPFENANELAEAVRSFLRANRSVIEDWHRRTKSQTMALTPLRETLAEKWHAMGSRDRERVQAESRVHERRIAQLADDDQALATASMSEVLALFGVIGIDTESILPAPGLPDLNHRQRAALGVAADEYEWSGSDVLALETRARLELARGGTRRLSLVTPADWVHFRSQTDPDA